MKFVKNLTLTGLSVALAACSALQSDKVDYGSAIKAPSLTVPPDLTQLPHDTRYTTPGATVSATGYQTSSQTSNANTVAPVFQGVQMQGQGPQRWLVVDQPPEKVWQQLKEFWMKIGLPLVSEDAQLGIMETDWAENRAKLPQDFLRRTLGTLLDGVFSTNMLDKYRTRIERTPSGGTEVYISHRGLEEVSAGSDGNRTVWQPRAPDTDMEVEMLRRFMVKLGATETQSTAAVAAVVPEQTARVDQIDGHPAVVVSDGFDRAWRRVGLTLDRTGFTVEDRDRSKGTYYVRFVEPRAPGETEPGFFSKLFSATPKDKTPQKYRVIVASKTENNSVVSLLDADGKPMPAEQAQRILKVIAEDLH